MRLADVERSRQETPGCANVVHLNNAGAALMPRQVLDRVVRHLNLEATVGGYEAAEQAEEDIDSVYRAAARLIGCRPDEIAIVDNASRAWSLALQAVPLGPGDRVVAGAAEYVSNYLALRAVCDQTGARFTVVPDTETGQIDLDALREAIDENTKLIALTQIPIYGGTVNPAVEVGRIARDIGAVYLVDACQSLGQMPVNVDELGCDLLTAAGRKYLRGPRGTSLIYARRDTLPALRSVSLDTRGLKWSGAREIVIHTDARRFESWETSFANKLGLGAAIEYALSYGVENGWNRIRELSQRLVDRLRQIDGIRLPTGLDMSCGVVSFEVDNGDSVKVQRMLREQKINVSVAESELTPLREPWACHNGLVRVSVHYYNIDAEVDNFGDSLESILRDNR